MGIIPEQVQSTVRALQLLQPLYEEEELPSVFRDDDDALQRLGFSESGSIINTFSINGLPGVEERAAVGSIMMRRERWNIAEQCMFAAVNSRTQQLGEDDEATIRALELHAVCELSLQRYEQAFTNFNNVSRARKHLLEGGDETALRADFNSCISAWWHFSTSEQGCDHILGALDGVLVSMQKHLGDMHAWTEVATLNLGYMYCGMGDDEQAAALLLEHMEKLKNERPVNETRILQTAMLLAMVYSEAEDAERLVSAYELIVEKRTELLGASSVATLTSQSNLATAIEARGDMDRAESLRVYIIEEIRRALPDNQDFLAHHDTMLAELRQRKVSTGTS